MKKSRSDWKFGYGHRRLRVEPLENRWMLAGNVTVIDSGPNIVIRGDDRDNGVLIQQQANGTYTIVGLSTDGTPTTINREDFVEADLGPGGSIIVDLRRGNDALAIGNNFGDIEDQVAGPFETAVLDLSLDVLDLPIIDDDEEDVFIPGSLIVTMAAGNDGVFAEDVTVFGSIVINTADGFDFVGLNEFEALSLTITTGNHDDFIDLSEFDLDTALTINTGNAARGGGDVVSAVQFTTGQGFGPNGDLIPPGSGPVTVVTGNGSDNVLLEDFDATSVVVNTGSGNDGDDVMPLGPNGTEAFVTILNAEIFTDGNDNGFIDFDDDGLPLERLGPVVLTTGAGRDLGFVVNITALTIVVNAGSENDTIGLFDSFIGVAAVFTMSTGNDDELDVFGNTFGPNSTLVADGGPGRSDMLRSDFVEDDGDPIMRNGRYNFGDADPRIVVVNFEEFFDFLPGIRASLADVFFASLGEGRGKRGG